MCRSLTCICPEALLIQRLIPHQCYGWNRKFLQWCHMARQAIASDIHLRVISQEILTLAGRLLIWHFIQIYQGPMGYLKPATMELKSWIQYYLSQNDPTITQNPIQISISEPLQQSLYGAYFIMMTSSNGNSFRVTGHLCGEFTGHQWIPRTKASDAELWCFLLSVPQ